MVASWFYTPQQNMKAWQGMGYWFPKDRKGAVFNDTITIPANAVPDSYKLLVKVYPGVFSQVLEGTEGMLRLPGG